MKTKSKISLFSVVLILVVVALMLYYVMYFAPAQTERNQLNAEVALNNAQAALCGAYLADHTPLEEGIAAVEAEIEELHTTAYTNEASVNLVISKAIQQHAVELTSMQVEISKEVEGRKVLPIQMSVNGSLQNVMNFIGFFENDTAGSYLVNSVNTEISNGNCIANVTMYLCTPAV